MTVLDRLIDTRPLRSSRPFRTLWVGTSASALGGQLTMVAVLFQVWQLTGSSVWVGVIGLATALPTVVFGLIGGSLADAIDRRTLVLCTTIGSLIISVLLAAQAFCEFDSLPLLLGLVALSAASGAIGSPARKTFVPRILRRDQVSAGIALTHLGFQAALLTGPVLGGVVIARWGLPACYLLDAITFGIALYGVAGLPGMPPAGTATRVGLRPIVAGWTYIARRPVLSGAFLADLAATVLAMPIAVFPAVNAERFGGAPETLGVLFAAVAIGGVGAGLLSGLVTHAGRPGAIQLAAAAVWGGALAGFGLAGWWPVALGCLVVAGAADTVSVISRGTVVQLGTADAYRGRVSSVEQIVGQAGPELGNLRGGLLAGLTSTGFALAGGGLLCVAAIAMIAVTHPELRHFTVAEHEVEPIG